MKTQIMPFDEVCVSLSHTHPPSSVTEDVVTVTILWTSICGISMISKYFFIRSNKLCKDKSPSAFIASCFAKIPTDAP